MIHNTPDDGQVNLAAHLGRVGDLVLDTLGESAGDQLNCLGERDAAVSGFPKRWLPPCLGAKMAVSRQPGPAALRTVARLAALLCASLLFCFFSEKTENSAARRRANFSIARCGSRSVQSPWAVGVAGDERKAEWRRDTSTWSDVHEGAAPGDLQGPKAHAPGDDLHSEDERHVWAIVSAAWASFSPRCPSPPWKQPLPQPAPTGISRGPALDECHPASSRRPGSREG